MALNFAFEEIFNICFNAKNLRKCDKLIKVIHGKSYC